MLGQEIACDDASCPGQDGFYQAGCLSESRYVDHGDGTVTDTCTGLMWQKETAPGPSDWQDALKYCDGLNFAGHDDWRLPNVRELQSIVDYGRRSPAIDPVFGALSAEYWSSSSGVDRPSIAWLVDFHDGYIVYGYVFCGNENGCFHVRAVRG